MQHTFYFRSSHLRPGEMEREVPALTIRHLTTLRSPCFARAMRALQTNASLSYLVLGSSYFGMNFPKFKMLSYPAAFIRASTYPDVPLSRDAQHAVTFCLIKLLETRVSTPLPLRRCQAEACLWRARSAIPAVPPRQRGENGRWKNVISQTARYGLPIFGGL